MKISAAADLEGKAVAVQLRSGEDEFLTANKLTDYPKRYSDMEKAVQDLADKKVAAVVVDSHYAQQLLQKYTAKDDVKLQIVKTGIGKVEYRFLLRKDDAALADKINARIAALRDSEEYAALVASEMTDGKSYEVSKDPEKELKSVLTLVTEPSFTPFTYRNGDEVRGLFASVADSVAYGCGARLEIKTVEPATDIDNEADTVKTSEGHAFCVVTEAAAEGADFVTTDVFYTSELVMIIRA